MEVIEGNWTSFQERVMFSDGQRWDLGLVFSAKCLRSCPLSSFNFNLSQLPRNSDNEDMPDIKIPIPIASENKTTLSYILDGASNVPFLAFCCLDSDPFVPVG